MISCSCCGQGCGEVKCPYNIENCDIEKYVKKKSSCLEKVNGRVQLKRNHQYYYQVQQQFFVADSEYCNFVVCSFDNNKQTKFFVERIYKDTSHWESVLPKLTKVWRSYILPEILGREFLESTTMLHLYQQVILRLFATAEITK
jgi:predicted DNA-binding ArsR family transcriptional regulator